MLFFCNNNNNNYKKLPTHLQQEQCHQISTNYTQIFHSLVFLFFYYCRRCDVQCSFMNSFIFIHIFYFYVSLTLFYILFFNSIYILYTAIISFRVNCIIVYCYSSYICYTLYNSIIIITIKEKYHSFVLYLRAHMLKVNFKEFQKFIKRSFMIFLNLL